MGMIAQVRAALQTMFYECAVLTNQEHCVIHRQRVFSPCSIAQTFILALLQNPPHQFCRDCRYGCWLQRPYDQASD